MGEVSVKVRVQPADSFGLTGTAEIRALDLNSAATGFARLNWTRAFDFNADGTRDLLNPAPTCRPRRPAHRPRSPACNCGWWARSGDNSTVTYGATSVANVLLTTGPVAIAGTG